MYKFGVSLMASGVRCLAGVAVWVWWPIDSPERLAKVAVAMFFGGIVLVGMSAVSVPPLGTDV
jgi:hypothetical protein